MTATRALPQSYIKIGKRYRKDLGDLSTLVDSIREIGLIQPIVVDKNHNLIVGHRRFEAWKIAKPDAAVPALIVDTFDDAKKRLEAERDENTCRKDMVASEIYEVGKAMERLERPKAAARTTANLPTVPAGALGEPGRTANAIAPVLGISPRQWNRLKAIGEAAAAGDKDAQADLAAVDAGKRTIVSAYNRQKATGERRTEPAAVENVGDLRTLPKARSATTLLERAAEQLGHYAHEIEGVDLAALPPERATAIAEQLAEVRSVLSRTINQLRSVA